MINRFHYLNPEAAARRLANYWKQRKDIFGERAFLPMNLSANGALSSDDIKLLRTGYFAPLPRDQKGRSVIVKDVSKAHPATHPSCRQVFFLLQCVMENKISQKDVFVMFWVINNPWAATFVMADLECARHLIRECMPVNMGRMHVIHIPPLGTTVDEDFILTSKSVLPLVLPQQ